MALPCVLISSSTDRFQPQEIVKDILKVSELPQPKVVRNYIEGYDWSFETKYYNTTVHLCAADNRIIGEKDFAESVQAFIHFFDPNVPSSFELAKAWLPFLSRMEPHILMLVCTTSNNSDAVTRKVVLEWCIQNAFELVELIPEEESGDDFPETTGMTRIVEALHAHIWPNLDMKSSPTVQSSFMRHMMEEQCMFNKQHEISKSSVSVHNSSELCQLPAHSDASKTFEHSKWDDNVRIVTKGSKVSQAICNMHTTIASPKDAYQMDSDRLNNTSSTAGESILHFDGIGLHSSQTVNDKTDKVVPLSDSHTEEDEFEELFMKLKFMKDKADDLPSEQRKRYAEKVAISFWKAIGGDEDEIDGVDEDSDY